MTSLREERVCSDRGATLGEPQTDCRCKEERQMPVKRMHPIARVQSPQVGALTLIAAYALLVQLSSHQLSAATNPPEATTNSSLARVPAGARAKAEVATACLEAPCLVGGANSSSGLHRPATERREDARAASILRPLILKGLFGSRRATEPPSAPASEAETEPAAAAAANGKSAGAQPESAEAEAARGQQRARPDGLQALESKPKEQEDDSEELVTQTIMVPIKEADSASASDDSGSAAAQEEALKPAAALQAHLAEVPLRPEASLQLTSTEMSSLLNDRDAPQFYRERELAGDGVVVGEERVPRVAASYESSQLLGRELAADNYPRLAQAASGGFRPGGEFQHRFGAGFMDGGGGGGDARLMQSPAEYAGHSMHQPADEFAGHSAGYSAGYEAGLSASHSNDYSPHSGLLRAGSGDYLGPEAHLAGFPSGGYSPAALKQHASELYSSGHYSSGAEHYAPSQAGHFYDGAGALENRLLAAGAGSHGRPARGYGLAPDEHLEAGFGRFGGAGYEPSGYASQTSAMRGAEPGAAGHEPARLLPLSGVIPTGAGEEDAAGSSALQQTDARALYQAAAGAEQLGEDDISSLVGQRPGQLGPEEREGPSASHAQEAREQADEPPAAPGQPQEEASLVLNAPPPRSTVEFLRTGSAGYLGPERAKGRHLQGFKRAMGFAGAANSGNEARTYDPANNPAHAGKYIID